jgi:hypothetical protein
VVSDEVVSIVSVLMVTVSVQVVVGAFVVGVSLVVVSVTASEEVVFVVVFVVVSSPDPEALPGPPVSPDEPPSSDSMRSPAGEPVKVDFVVVKWDPADDSACEKQAGKRASRMSFFMFHLVPLHAEKPEPRPRSRGWSRA